MGIFARAVAGAAAGMWATVLMTGAMAVTKKAGLLGEPPPRKLTRKMMAAVGLPLKKRTVDVATVAGHLGYGAGMGALFGLVPRRSASLWGGLAFGLAVWGASYAGWIPAVGFMRRPSSDRTGRPTAMILAHLVYGATLARTLGKFDVRGSDHRRG